ncbi:hypothetical protein F5Y12DRAFT_232159 [Xylaria sp. FL1777]|nr:hypothetical protein F5Y12DRAFT_232159 [Xylaria sp. FL1777]
MAEQRKFNALTRIEHVSNHLFHGMKNFTILNRRLVPEPGPIRARQEVFCIPELFDQIILELDWRTILVSAQRVSKHWYCYINQSTIIQMQLWLRKQAKEPRHEQTPESNPLLVRFMPCFFHHPAWKEVPISTELLYTKTGLHDDTWRPRWLAPNASWRNMLFAQPAVTKLRWELWEFENGALLVHIPTLKAEFDIPGGLTMGQVYDLVVGTAGRHMIKKPDTVHPNRAGRPQHGTEDPLGLEENEDKSVELVIQQQLQHGRLEYWVSRGLPEPIPRSLIGGGSRDLSHFKENMSSLECLFRTSEGHIYIDEFAILGPEICLEFFLSATQSEQCLD